MSLPHLDQLTAVTLRSPIWVYDITGQQLAWANPAALELWEATELEELCARDFASDQSQAVQQTLLSYLERFQKGESFDTWWEICPRGMPKRVFCRLSGVNIPCETGTRPAMLLEGQYSPALLNRGDIPSAAIAVLFDEAGNIISFNPPFADQFGEQISNLRQILAEDSGVSFVQEMGSLGRDLELKTLKGLRWHHAEITTQPDLSESPCYALTLLDIQARKLREIETANEARSDFLTGLLNRRGLLRYMDNYRGTEFSLLYIDLDGFKPINDSYGHNAGDELLRQLANVLMAQSGRKVCARVGGDEFIILFLGHLSKRQLKIQTETLLADISHPYEVAPQCIVQVSASIGIASAPLDSTDMDELLTQADAAMYEAKKQGRNQAVIYQSGMESDLHRRAQILQYLDAAISDNQLEVHYQPIVHASNRKPVLVEALLRWQHPTLGPLSPLVCIAAAESSGKIARLQDWVIERVCLDIRRIRQRFSPDIKVSVNISGTHITQPDFSHRLLQTLSKHNCTPQDLLLEVSESRLVPVIAEQHPCLNQLVNAGFELAIDDFGTGHSSLAYLSQLPASYVKIDKVFIQRLKQDPHTLLFIRNLCTTFKMQCIAEGVEQAEQRKLLNNAGIELQQGYYYCKPQSLAQLTARKSAALQQQALQLKEARVKCSEATISSEVS